MNRAHAIALLGENISQAASTLGVSHQAVYRWPPKLPRRIADRVLGAYMRKNMPGLVKNLLDESAGRVSAGQPAEQEASHV